ncbi:putative CyP450 monooxygenase [Marasmius fiardii PR-910]|nr:putative CyP450 monooxygenase [Marasmius fiardii PR-910]
MYRLAVISLLLFIALFVRRHIFKSRGGLPLPPGPPRHLIWGNLEDLKTKKDEPRWITYRNLSRRYGDVVYAEVFGDETVILNSYKATTELLEKRSRNYSDRPHMIMADDLMGWTWDFVHMSYGDKWRIHRKTFHQYFQQRNVPEFHVIQQAAAKALLRKLATSPEGYYEHVKHHAGFIILKLAYGYELQSNNDPYVDLAAKALAAVTQAVNHGAFAVDYLPILKHLPSWLPGASFKRKAQTWAPLATEVRELPWKLMKNAMTDGTGPPSFASQNLEKFSEDPGMEDIIKNCAAIAYIAGSDTTVAMLHSFILAMVLHLDVQERAQDELKEVVGLSRLPDFKDRPRLPFIEAILAETFRWHPAVPLAIPHRSLEDDVYEGYVIPAGATIVPNTGAILHDENLYGPDVEEFNPNRFMKQPEKDLPPHPDEFAFGFGRRACPGRYLADHSLWIAMVYLLSVFNIKKALDSEGNEIEPEVRYKDGTVSHPCPFKCRFVPRSKDALDFIA